MKYGIIIIMVLLLASCGINKNVAKTKEEKVEAETMSISRKRTGDSVSLLIPKITFKDTTIYRRNVQGTVVSATFDSVGDVEQVDCYTSTIDELIEMNRVLLSKFDNKEKQEKIQTDRYFIKGILLIIGIFIIYVIVRIEMIVRKFI